MIPSPAKHHCSNVNADRFGNLASRVVTIFSIVGVVFMLVFGIVNLLRGFTLLGIMEEGILLVLIINLFYLKKTKNLELAGNVILLVMLFLYAGLFCWLSKDVTNVYWFYTYPILALFLKGPGRGLAWCFVQLVLVAAFGAAAHLGFFTYDGLTSYEYIMLFFSLILVLMLVYFYEYLRQEYQKDHEILQKEMFETVSLREQLEYAEKMQQALLPQLYMQFPPFESILFYRPTMAIGGDYVDYQRASRDRMLFVTGDVSGKGISASLVMVNMRSVFQNAITHGVSSPAVILKLFNSRMLDETAHEMYFAASVFMYDRSVSKVTYCNAGIGPFLVYKKSQGKVLEFPSPYMPCGVSENPDQYINGEIDVETGDIIIAFTDGLEEAWESIGSENGRQIIKKRLEDAASQPIDKLRDYLLPDFSQMLTNGRRYDDVALILGRVSE